jgi:cbb3-type cytochrome oxidase maturation protein
MSSLFILIAISLLVAGGFLSVFIWSVRNGQYDDDYTPSVRILFENEVNQGKSLDVTTKDKNEPTKTITGYKNL